MIELLHSYSVQELKYCPTSTHKPILTTHHLLPKTIDCTHFLTIPSHYHKQIPQFTLLSSSFDRVDAERTQNTEHNATLILTPYPVCPTNNRYVSQSTWDPNSCPSVIRSVHNHNLYSTWRLAEHRVSDLQIQEDIGNWGDGAWSLCRGTVCVTCNLCTWSFVYVSYCSRDSDLDLGVRREGNLYLCVWDGVSYFY